MAWTSNPSPLVVPQRQGWAVTPTVAPSPPQVRGWWVAIGLDNALTVQFVTQAELTAIKTLGLVRSVGATRDLALQGVYMVDANRQLTMSRSLGLQGTYMADLALTETVSRSLALARVTGIDLASALNVDTALSLGLVQPLTAASSVGVDRSLGLTRVVQEDFSQTLSADRAVALGLVAKLDSSQALTMTASATLEVIKSRVDQTDGFNYSAPLATQLPAFWKVLAGTPTAQGTQFTAPATRNDAVGTMFECATDRIRIDCVLGTKNTGKSGIIICADANFTKFVYVELETGTFTNQWHLVTQLSGIQQVANFRYNQGTYLRRNDVNADSAAGVTCSISYDSVDNTFRTYRNGTLVNTWVDTTNLIPHGAGFRYGGLIVDSEATTNKGAWFDSFRIYDM